MEDFEKFKKYKNDWSYASQMANPGYIPSGSRYRGTCATFQSAMRVMLIIGQCFALNPVQGVCEVDVFKLRFTVRSWKFVYTVLSIAGQLVFVGFCILQLCNETEPSLSSKTSIMFYSSNCLTTIMFLRLAVKWPKFCQHISRTEASDPYVDPILIRKCNVSCVVILGLALMEHILSDLSGFATASDCNPDKNLYESFVIQSFPWIFELVPYNHYVGFLTQFINIQCTFNWNFADLFVICMSFYLVSRLDRVNKRIISVKGQDVPISYWRTMREDYNRVTSLVRLVDDTIGGIIFITFANNLFFICLQLLHTLAEGIKSAPRCRPGDSDGRPFRGYEPAVYFVYSFMFLVMRWLSVSLAAAKVHSASRQPAYALYHVSSNNYCIEIQRFLEQIHGDTVALSGLQFFKIKRGLVLTIAGTIVTYELVLMQFTGVTPTSPTPI